jgi:hypothetical protein
LGEYFRIRAEAIQDNAGPGPHEFPLLYEPGAFKPFFLGHTQQTRDILGCQSGNMEIGFLLEGTKRANQHEGTD